MKTTKLFNTEWNKICRKGILPAVIGWAVLMAVAVRVGEYILTTNLAFVFSFYISIFIRMMPCIIAIMVPCLYVALDCKKNRFGEDVAKESNPSKLFFIKHSNALILIIIAVVVYALLCLCFGAKNGLNVLAGGAITARNFFNFLIYFMLMSIALTAICNLVATLTHSFWIVFLTATVPFWIDFLIVSSGGTIAIMASYFEGFNNVMHGNGFGSMGVYWIYTVLLIIAPTIASFFFYRTRGKKLLVVPQYTTAKQPT